MGTSEIILNNIFLTFSNYNDNINLLIERVVIMEVKSLAKKMFFLYVSFALIVSFFGVQVSAEENNTVSTKINDYSVCTLPKESSNNKNEEFIQFIEKEYSISRNDENVFVQHNENGTVSITIIESDDLITSYTSPTENEAALLNEYNGKEKGIIWTALVWLYRALKVGSAIKTGCQVIQGVSGEDVCGYVSKEVINSLVKTGTKKKFKVVRSVEKKACPYPPHSLQCNQAPFAYWKTTLHAY